MTQAYIVDALRTAGGRRGGALKDWHPADLGAAVLDALVGQAGIDPAAIEDVIVGCVSQAGEQSFHVGRNMVLASSLPDTVPAVTIDRQCGSSQQALHFAAQAVMSGTQDMVIAAGVESMTRVPMGTPVILPMQAGIGIGPWPQSIKDRYGVTDSTPAAMTTSCVPLITACAAKWRACCELPHWRSMVTAGTLSGSDDASTMLRPMWKLCSPTWLTQPTMTSSITAGSIPLPATSASSTAAPMSAGCKSRNAPPRRPPAVRNASTI